MAKEFNFRGKTPSELAELSHADFAKLVKARARRKLLRGLSDVEKKLLIRIKKLKDSKKKIKTQSREMLALPEMIGATIHVYMGKEHFPVTITSEMLGHRLGEFALTRREVKHKAPGIGATKSSRSASVK